MTPGLLMFATISAFASALLLALSQDRNWRLTYGPGAGRWRMMRLLGWSLVLLTPTLCIVRDGVSFGIILGLFVLATAFVAVVLMLAFCPRWLRPFALLFATDGEGKPPPSRLS